MIWRCHCFIFQVTPHSPTLELSNSDKGFSPPLQISHNVVPKLHLSEARLRLAGSSIHSGGTQGILSIRTDQTKTFNPLLSVNSSFSIRRHFQERFSLTLCNDWIIPARHIGIVLPLLQLHTTQKEVLQCNVDLRRYHLTEVKTLFYSFPCWT